MIWCTVTHTSHDKHLRFSPNSDLFSGTSLLSSTLNFTHIGQETWNVRVEIYSLSKLWLPLRHFHEIHTYSTQYEKILHKEFHENMTQCVVADTALHTDEKRADASGHHGRFSSFYFVNYAWDRKHLYGCTRWFEYHRDWFVCKQAALRSSCATLRGWSHNLHPPSCSG